MLVYLIFFLQNNYQTIKPFSIIVLLKHVFDSRLMQFEKCFRSVFIQLRNHVENHGKEEGLFNKRLHNLTQFKQPTDRWHHDAES